MLPGLGYFKTIPCPFFSSGFCERPYCHFKHAIDKEGSGSKLSNLNEDANTLEETTAPISSYSTTDAGAAKKGNVDPKAAPAVAAAAAAQEPMAAATATGPSKEATAGAALTDAAGVVAATLPAIVGLAGNQPGLNKEVLESLIEQAVKKVLGEQKPALPIANTPDVLQAKVKPEPAEEDDDIVIEFENITPLSEDPPKPVVKNLTPETSIGARDESKKGDKGDGTGSSAATDKNDSTASKKPKNIPATCQLSSGLVAAASILKPTSAALPKGNSGKKTYSYKPAGKAGKEPNIFGDTEDISESDGESETPDLLGSILVEGNRSGVLTGGIRSEFEEQVIQDKWKATQKKVAANKASEEDSGKKSQGEEDEVDQVEAAQCATVTSSSGLGQDSGAGKSKAEDEAKQGEAVEDYEENKLRQEEEEIRKLEEKRRILENYYKNKMKTKGGKVPDKSSSASDKGLAKSDKDKPGTKVNSNAEEPVGPNNKVKPSDPSKADNAPSLMSKSGPKDSSAKVDHKSSSSHKSRSTRGKHDSRSRSSHKRRHHHDDSSRERSRKHKRRRRSSSEEESDSEYDSEIDSESESSSSSDRKRRRSKKSRHHKHRKRSKNKKKRSKRHKDRKHKRRKHSSDSSSISSSEEEDSDVISATEDEATTKRKEEQVAVASRKDKVNRQQSKIDDSMPDKSQGEKETEEYHELGQMDVKAEVLGGGKAKPEPTEEEQFEDFKSAEAMIRQLLESKLVKPAPKSENVLQSEQKPLSAEPSNTIPEPVIKIRKLSDLIEQPGPSISLNPQPLQPASLLPCARDSLGSEGETFDQMIARHQNSWIDDQPDALIVPTHEAGTNSDLDIAAESCTPEETDNGENLDNDGKSFLEAMTELDKPSKQDKDRGRNKGISDKHRSESKSKHSHKDKDDKERRHKDSKSRDSRDRSKSSHQSASSSSHKKHRKRSHSGHRDSTSERKDEHTRSKSSKDKKREHKSKESDKDRYKDRSSREIKKRDRSDRTSGSDNRAGNSSSSVERACNSSQDDGGGNSPLPDISAELDLLTDDMMADFNSENDGDVDAGMASIFGEDEAEEDVLKRLFDDYTVETAQRVEATSTSTRQVAAAQSTTGPSETNIHSSKKRVAHAGQQGEGSAAKRPLNMLRPQKRTPAQIMMDRYKKIQNMRQMQNMEKRLGQITEDEPQPGPSSESSDQALGRARKAHVPSSNKKFVLMGNARSQLEARNAASSSENRTTLAQTQNKGSNRVAHTPTNPVVAKPTISHDSHSKVPANVRQKYLNSITDECLKIYGGDELEAYPRAVREEGDCSRKASSRMLYCNLVVNTIKKLRREADEAKAASRGKVVNTGDRKRNLMTTHLQVLAGKSGTIGTWSIEKPIRVTDEDIDETLLFSIMKNYVLTEEQLVDNGFPRRDPKEKGKAIVKVDPLRIKNVPSDPELRLCDRCNKTYRVDKHGLQVDKDDCLYHWGRTYRKRGNRATGGGQTVFYCCNMSTDSDGCQVAPVHVTNVLDYNNMRGFVSTLDTPGDGKVFALDCEMCNTTMGCELTRVTVIDHKGQVCYESLVMPDNPIIDYNTRFSGLTEDDLRGVKTSLRDVQAVLLLKFKASDILIGHSLESDLKVLRLLHSTVVDTSVVFPHKMGPPYKRALKFLASDHLKRIIQESESGHDSKEDALACLDLMKMKVREDVKKLQIQARRQILPK